MDEFKTFIRKPFVVEAKQITKENIEELAPLVGTLEKNADGDYFIRINRDIVPNMHEAYAGFWITRMGRNFRCYASNVFAQQFVQTTPVIDDWVKYMNDASNFANAGGGSG